MKVNEQYRKTLKSIHSGIVYRTTNENCKSFKDYMGRGIKVSRSWLKFENFYRDMIKTYEPGLSVDRIDVNGNYCKENCKWANATEQAWNRRSTVFIEHDDKILPIAEWSRLTGINERVISDRLKMVMKNRITVAEIFSIPVKRISKKALGF